MTGYTVHTGSTVKFSTGWDHIFVPTSGTSDKPPSTKAAKKKSKKRPQSGESLGAKRAKGKKVQAKKSATSKRGKK